MCVCVCVCVFLGSNIACFSALSVFRTSLTNKTVIPKSSLRIPKSVFLETLLQRRATDTCDTLCDTCNYFPITALFTWTLPTVICFFCPYTVLPESIDPSGCSQTSVTACNGLGFGCRFTTLVSCKAAAD